MILIADSGATKAHWCIADQTGKLKEVITPGISPYYQTEEEIRLLLANQLIPEIKNFQPEAIFYYGTGCAFSEKQSIIRNALGAFFKDTPITIESDLLAACHALFHNQHGIACILGTGSNSCFYDGEKIINNVPALGFILGDEGSGATLGRRLVSDLLKNQLSEELRNKFLAQYDLTMPVVLDKVYKQPFPNRFLAGFAPFILENIANQDIYEMVCSEFDLFIKRNLKQYPYTEYPAGFVGSIAWHFKEPLQKVLSQNGITTACIIHSPMEKLIDYHVK